MDDLPSNARRAKEPERHEPKKVEKVIVGDIVRRKKPIRKKLAETFVGGDAKSVGGYLVVDVIIPQLKDMIADSFSMGVEKMLFGEARSTSRRNGRKPNDSYIAYNRYSSNRDNRDRDRDRGPQMSRRARANFNFDEVIIPTRHEADEVLDKLFDLLAKYEMVTVADLYSLIGVEGSYTDEKYGWTDLRGAGATRINSGYLLELPQPEPLN